MMDPNVESKEANAYLNDLARVLKDRAAWVYGRLTDAARYQVSMQEETLTEDLLLDIALRLPKNPDLTLSHFTRNEEKDNGADWQWEWWFHGHRWFGVRIQAKKLRPRRAGGPVGYDLAYEIGNERTGRRKQIKVLLEQARADHIAPAYVFYNGPELDLGTFTWGCGGIPASCEDFGVSYLHASVIDQLLRLGKADLEAVMSASRPWPCLIRCDPGMGCYPRVPPPLPFSTPFDEAIAWSLFRTVVESPVANTSQRDPFRYLQDRVNDYCHDTPPEYVQRLADGTTGIDTLLRPSVRAVTLLSHQ